MQRSFFPPQQESPGAPETEPAGESLTTGSLPAAPQCILISACLLGENCTYKAGNEARPDLITALTTPPAPHTAQPKIFAFCPEIAAGLPIPRPRCEISDGDGRAVLCGTSSVQDAEGNDHTDAYRRGAFAALLFAQKQGIRLAILKNRSPSCGSAGVYDGSHSKTWHPDGIGVTAALLEAAEIEVLTEAAALARLETKTRKLPP